MHPSSSPLIIRSLAVLSLGVIVACSGSSTPTSAPLVTPSTAPSIAPVGQPSASPSPTTPGATTCQYGPGTVTASCARHVPAFVADVDAAIAQLVNEHPEIFDLGRTSGDGQYYVKDVDAYYAGVIRNLEARNFCAGFDFVELQVKNSNSFSEQYNILLSNQHARRGDGSYRATCSPPNFPLTAEDIIDHVRVGFFGFRCSDGITPPRNGENRLPVGCSGNVTATPKNYRGEDVDARIHGDRIDWRLEQDHAGIVRMDDFPGVDFNKTLTGLEKGHFTVCAEVRGVTGCLHGEVTEP